MADKSDRGTEVAEGGKGDSEAKDDAEMAAVDTQLIGRVCFEVLTLKHYSKLQEQLGFVPRKKVAMKLLRSVGL